MAATWAGLGLATAQVTQSLGPIETPQLSQVQLPWRRPPLWTGRCFCKSPWSHACDGNDKLWVPGTLQPSVWGPGGESTPVRNSSAVWAGRCF